MSYEAIVEKLKTVPEECLVDIENYIQFVLYRYSQKLKTEKTPNLSKYFGSVNFKKDGLAIQADMREEWN